VTNREIAEQIMANPCVWNPIDGDNPYGSVDLDWIRDAITAALDAARPPAGHIMEHDGTVSRLDGELVKTEDGTVIGKGARVWPLYPVELSGDEDDVAPVTLKYAVIDPMDGAELDDGDWADIGKCYSTREAAEAAKRAAGGGA
jgi:hypothetical protein